MNQRHLQTGNIATASLRIRMLSVCIAALGVLASVGLLPGQGSKPPEQDSASAPISPAPSQSMAASNRPAVPRVATGTFDSLGRPISISCASCHANFEPNLETRNGKQLEQFHQGLSFAHGKLTCLTCHNAKNYNLLRLAGEQPLDFSQVQTLCGQCHSKQSNDYQHGAHGGMNGHWNLARGARVRKLCVDCHDPHAPAFPAMVKTFEPQDRFLKSKIASPSRSTHE